LDLFKKPHGKVGLFIVKLSKVFSVIFQNYCSRHFSQPLVWLDFKYAGIAMP
jgi:hypothetical protein